MLCGRAPFQPTVGRDDSSAVSVMQRIKSGDFNFDGPAWKHVSSQAKHVIRGARRRQKHSFADICSIIFNFDSI